VIISMSLVKHLRQVRSIVYSSKVLLTYTSLVTFVQPKFAILLGSIILPVGLGLLTRSLHLNVLGEIYGFLAMTGVGLGLTMSANTIQVRFSQPPDKIAAVVSLSTFVSHSYTASS